MWVIANKKCEPIFVEFARKGWNQEGKIYCINTDSKFAKLGASSDSFFIGLNCLFL